jgi:hypothetical protein
VTIGWGGIRFFPMTGPVGANQTKLSRIIVFGPFAIFENNGYKQELKSGFHEDLRIF